MSQSVGQSVSQSDSDTFSSHLMLIKCLTLPLRVSIQHHILAIILKPGCFKMIILCHAHSVVPYGASLLVPLNPVQDHVHWVQCTLAQSLFRQRNTVQ